MCHSPWSSKESDTTQWLNNQHHHQISQLGWFVNSRNLFLIVPEAERPRSGVSMVGSGENLLPGCRLPTSQCSHMVEGARKFSGVSLIRALIPLQGLHPHDLGTAQRPYLLMSSFYGLGF